nr:hypothetical protein [Pseudomonas sp. LPH1]
MDRDSEFKAKLFKEFHNESDRGCAVLTVCLLEETLLKVFSKVLPGGEASAKISMPRGRLSAGVGNAEALGLITEPHTTNIKLILKIRNIFAHKLMAGLTFESQEIKEQAIKLILPNFDGVSNETKQKLEISHRMRYVEVFVHTLGNLNRLVLVAKKYPSYPSLPMFTVEV